MDMRPVSGTLFMAIYTLTDRAVRSLVGFEQPI